jgi:hypothetical protein
MKTNLEKLQILCNAVNKRYAKGLNDDDQVAKMFKFASSQNDAVVVIGYDDYQAISKQVLLDLCDRSKDKVVDGGKTTFKLIMDGKSYTGIIKN